MAEQNQNTTQQNTQQGTGGSQQTPNYDEIFSKLDAILDKRSDGLAKSALKDNGVDEGEIADIVKAYRDQKQNKAAEQANALTAAQNQIADLQKQIAAKDLDTALTSAAMELNLDLKQLPYVTRLVDRAAAVDENGKPDAERIKAAITKVLDDVPALKASPEHGNGKGFQTVGNKNGDGGAGSGEDAEKRLRSYFGLK